MADTSGAFNVFVEEFRAQSEGNLERLTALASQLGNLAKQYDDARRDLERERVAGRHTQQVAETLKGSLRNLEESTMRGAFVLVLVDADADAYLFDDKYYAGDPAEGGERASADLKTATQQYLKVARPHLAGLPVMARAFAFGDGLATLLGKARIAKPGESQQVLSRFTCGFSQADEMFDFVLVGKGKDRADHKLMGAFRQFVESPSCQHILLACCHDNGYVRMLEKYIHAPSVVEKVTMIKSFQIGSEFAGLPFHSTSMETIFRSRPLAGGGALATNAKYIAPVGDVAPTDGPLFPNGHTKMSSPPITYATRAATSTQAGVLTTPKPRLIPTYGTLDKDVILVNAEGHRIDMLLPPQSATVAQHFNFKTHVGGKRFCNMFHLYGTCPGGCGYLHDPLTAAEKLVLRHKRRNEKCHERGKCRDPLCFYGHHCTCPGPAKKCSFPLTMHGVDLASWREVNVASLIQE